MRRVWRGLSGLFWARRCLACGDESLAPVCVVCAGDAVPRAGDRCRVCDVGFSVVGPARRCRACLRRAPGYDRAWGVFEYESVVGEAVRAGKYGQVPGALDWVAQRLAGALPRSLVADPPTAVVPVPLHWRRVERRRCAPPLLLGRAVARGLGVPLRRRVARRLRDTPEQAGLDASARRRSLRGAFTARAAPADVVVVDDVLTTGATLSAVAAALRGAGAERVRGLAALRVASAQNA